MAAAILIVAVGAVYFYLRSKRLTDFEPLIREKIQSLVKEGSKGLYHIDIGKIDIDVLASKVLLENIHLGYDTVLYKQQDSATAPGDLFDVSVSRLEIDGLTPLDILKKKNLRLNLLEINNPVVHVHHYFGNREKVKDSTTLYERITKQIGSFGIKELQLKNASIDFINLKSGSEDHFPEINITLNDFLIDASTQNDTSRFFYAKDADISVVKYSRRTADSLYTLRLDSVNIQAVHKEVTIKKFQLLPTLSKAAFRKTLPVRKDRFEIVFSDIKITNINWWGMIAGDIVSIGEILLANGKAEVYSDKTLPKGKNPGNGNYPQQKLFKTNMPIHIQKINIKNLDFIYAEFNEDSYKEGKIYFQNTDAVISNITNIPQHIAINPMLTIDAHILKSFPVPVWKDQS